VRVAAYFDVDGTITKTTILHPLIWYQRAHLSMPRFVLFALGLLARVPYYLWTDRRSRGRFNIVFYRQYAGLRMESLRDWHRRSFAENLQRTIFPAAVECVRDHRRQGHRIVLVTGGLDCVVRPLADYLEADELLANRLVERDGICTGELDGPPLADAHKAELVGEYAHRHGIDMGLSFAYGNSLGDAAMLNSVGHHIVVNPDRRLRRLARTRGWPVMEWASA
jgi:HAD superfamily hydrolase (TIGR01490 family)